MLVIILTVCRPETPPHAYTINPEEEKKQPTVAGSEYANQEESKRCNDTITMQYIDLNTLPGPYVINITNPLSEELKM
jgi:hypothetical protein